jgi:serine/threonine protein kinase
MASRFGNYTLLHRLAKGGMGDVFVAQHGGIAGMEKLCVVKRLRPDLADDEAFLRRFQEEARLVVKLSHRNVGQVFDVGQVGDRFYLGMELIAGIDARRLLKRKATGKAQVVEAVALFIVAEVLEALSYAHRLQDPVSGEQLRVIHRDVSPQNVMLSFEGEVKLIDFGLAHAGVEPATEDDGAGHKTVLGKLTYMSPEQARGDDVDERGDLFSAAILAAELVTGRRFYEGLSHDAIWRVAGKAGHRPPSWSFLHKGLQRVLDKALQPAADDRYPTAEAFKEALDGYTFARGYRSAPKALREVLDRDFADAKDDHRALLVEIQQAQATAAEAPEPPVVERTRIIATSGSLSDVGAADDTSPRAAAPDAPTAPLPTLTRARAEATAPPDRDRTLLIVAASAGALFVVLLIGLVALLASGDEPPEAPASEPVASAAPAGPAPGAPAVVDAGASAQTKKEKKRRRRQKAATTVPKARPPSPGLAASERDQRRYLKTHCEDVPCASRVLKQRLPMGATLEDKRAAAKALANCVYRCSRLPMP